MYGRWEGELWFHRRHMWPVPSSSKPSVAAPSNSFVLIDTNSFSKDGRTIHVGDCALFKPSHNSLPFVGLIRKLKVGKENNLTLSVNWLYRPADIKLKEGASLEAAPNEIFYSFHKDEIPAASLLHPCKVAFLPKNLELPSGISSFVCRRVYDIESKCLWWLTDQDYINERQQEVDKLLDKTRVEMYGALQTQTGGRSPKPLNGSQLKPSSDNVQNSSSSISSHAKSKKRDHGVHKSKVDDADSGQLRPDHIIKTEISKITDKGGLMDFQGVEKLIQLMRPENTDKKLDLSSRTMLVDVISVTERFDYLTRFVQLRGLSVLDEWLQEIHKGKIGDGNGSPKENDKSVEDFLFSLLRALDRLPVNLHALQTCNVGKSVNHLRSHKNSEIQKKARSLVSTWKRRVEAEMTMIETKSSTSRGGSWPSKSMMSDVSHLGNRRSTSTSQPSPLKSPQQPKVNNNNSGEPAAKSPADKLAATGGGGGSSDMPSSGTKEGRSSSTTHSPNNSQSCSSDHGKTGSVYNSRNSSNGFHGSTTPGNEKGNLGKIRNFGNEKGLGSGSGSPAGHVSDVSIVDNGNNQSVVAPSEKQDQKTSGKIVNDSLQSNVEKMDTDGKDGTEGCDDAKSATVTVVLPDEHGGSSSGVTPKPGKLYEPSYSSINALVESCAKFSEASVSVSPSMGDDGGMNLLASVAAGEISRSDVACSPPLPEDSCSANVAKLRRIVQDEDNGPHVSGDSKDATFGKGEVRMGSESESLIPVAVKPEVKTGMVEVEEKNVDDKVIEKNVILPESCKVETQVNEESASWSSSDMHDEEKKKLVNNRSRNLQESQATTTSCGDADLAIKFEERDDDKKAGIHNEMDSGASISHENIGKHEADDPDSAINISATAPVAETETETETVVKLDFDLNEVVPSDDGNQGEVDGNQNHTLPSNSPVDGNRSPLITVAAPAKGPFYPSENLSRTKPELGWKGSAATSAFRPAKPVRPLFDFDLNVGVDDSGQNNAHENSGGGLDLDLNACQEPPETVQLPPRAFPSNSNSNSNSSRGFDLNGPGVEEVINIIPGGGETVQFPKKGMQFLPAVPNMRVNNNMDIGVNMSSWFPPNNTYPTTITIPSIQEQSYVPSQRMLSPVLSSTPAVVPFQYSPFPFETNFPLPNSFPPVSTAYMDSSPAGGPTPTPGPGPGPGPICFPTQTQLVPMPYRPSYFMSLPGGSSNPGKWGGGGGGGGGGGLDLNSGPGGNTGGVSKRKEPDGGWDGDRISYKHPSWQ